MESARHYAELRTDTYDSRKWEKGITTGNFAGLYMYLEQNETYKGEGSEELESTAVNEENDKADSLREAYEAMKSNAAASVSDPEDSFLSLKAACINFLLMILFGFKRTELETDGGSLDAYGIPNMDMPTGGSYSEYHYSYQNETTVFSTTGKVVTEDGRSIDFNLDVSMSREFIEESNLEINYGEPMYCDPLVVYTKALPASVSDQTFSFDIDSDGIEDKINKLVNGAGFLALDANDDGIINDGSELFGTKSGNGFKDLAAFDDDNNGWIDENDEIFDRLVIWTKDENGKDALVKLKDGDIGAISLQSARTDFSVNDMTNAALSQVRRTGFFLHESTGEPGVIQQMDMVKQLA